MANEVYIFFGPDKMFNKLVESNEVKDGVSVGLLEAIRIYDTKIRATNYATPEMFDNMPEKVDNCIVRAADFGSVVSHTVSNFAGVLEQAFKTDKLFVQNPPARALHSLTAAYEEADIHIMHHDYGAIKKTDLPGIYNVLKTDVLGQEKSKRALITALYQLIVMSDHRPVAILFLGKSGVGKTETARALSRAMGGKLTRIQFSMMQTTEAFDYLFGAEHSKASFARDLLGRESNIVLIDEFDKVQPGLYNMFYQLFDEGRYVDTNYDVDMRNGMFLLTSNFSSEREAKKKLGAAMFSRIDACIAFDDLSAENKAIIAKRRYDEVVNRLDQEDRKVIEESRILDWLQSNANRYDNMRTMKHKIDKAIFEKLSAPILDAREMVSLERDGHNE